MDWRKLAACLLLCFVAAAAGGFFTGPAITGWYAGINKPWFTPPNWLFAPVWTALYTMMGISLYLVWASKVGEKRTGAAVFLAQLVLNVAWSAVFFGARNPLGGLAIIIALEAAIVACIALFRRLSPTAALLLVPYAAWVAFAGMLNYAILALN